jgi:hypothetical protein
MDESANTPPGGIKRNYSLRLGLNRYKPSIASFGMPQPSGWRKSHGNGHSESTHREQQGAPHSLSRRGFCRIVEIRAHCSTYPKV